MTLIDLHAERLVLGACLYGEYPADQLQLGDFYAPDHKYVLAALQADADPVAVLRHLLEGMQDHPGPASLLAALMHASLDWNEPPVVIEARVRALRILGARRRLLVIAESVIEELKGGAA